MHMGMGKLMTEKIALNITKYNQHCGQITKQKFEITSKDKLHFVLIKSNMHMLMGYETQKC